MGVVILIPGGGYIWPNATNTGVPAGTVLTTYAGPADITTPNTVVDSQIISGMLTISTSGVVVKNCLFTGNDTWQINGDNASNMTVQDSEFRGGTQTILGNGNFLRLNIWDTIIGLTLNNGPSFISRCYIHDLRPDDIQHHDGIFIGGGQINCLIQDNWISTPGNSGTAEIFIATRFGDITNTTVNHNRLIGTPSYAMYSEQTAAGVITGTRWTNNEVQSGAFGYWSITNNTVFRSGNVDAFTFVNIDNT